MKTVYLNAAYFPGGRAALRARDGRDPGDRRDRGDQRPHLDRRRVRVHRGAQQLLRPDPAALAALHDLPVRDGGARQDLRAARRAARAAATRRTRSSCRRSAASCASTTSRSATAPTGRRPGRCATSTSRSRAGQTVALVGATGAGKSTFAKLVARFYDPTDGRVLVDGHDLRSISAHSLRSQMGIVPQEAFLFSGTVRENIAFGRAGRHRRGDRDGRPRRRRPRVHHGARARLRHAGR